MPNETEALEELDRIFDETPGGESVVPAIVALILRYFAAGEKRGELKGRAAGLREAETIWYDMTHEQQTSRSTSGLTRRPRGRMLTGPPRRRNARSGFR